MPSTTLATALSMPRLRSIGFAPAATFFKPTLMIACASTVAVVVPSPASSPVFDATSFTSCAPMFWNSSSSSTAFATVTPSFVMWGAPNFLSTITLRPFGPSVTFTAFANSSTPFFSSSRALISNLISLAMIFSFFLIVDKLIIRGLPKCHSGASPDTSCRRIPAQCRHTCRKAPCRLLLQPFLHPLCHCL